MSHMVKAVDPSWVLENKRLSRSCIANVCIVIRQSVKVEARAMLEGLKIAWVCGFRRVEVESDNVLLVDILRNGLTGTKSVVKVRMIHTWVSKNLQVRYKLISRDSNRLDDCITNEAI
ncbi:hypothetical protein Golax_015156, partial [Gossypium laxum]|nr:hypothetical protein [Gossypium laxum]